MNGLIEITLAEAEEIARSRNAGLYGVSAWRVHSSSDEGDHFRIALSVPDGTAGTDVIVPKFFPAALEEDLAEPLPDEHEPDLITATHIVGEQPSRSVELLLERIDKRRRILELGVACNALLVLGSDQPLDPGESRKFEARSQVPVKIHRFVPFRGSGLRVRRFGVGNCVLGEIGWSDIALDAEFWSALTFDIPDPTSPAGAQRFRDPWIALPGLSVWCDVENPRSNGPQCFAAVVYGLMRDFEP